MTKLVGALAAVLMVGGFAAVIVGLVLGGADTRVAKAEAIVEGEVAGLGARPNQPQSFVVPESGRYTVWLDMFARVPKDQRRNVARSTLCRVSFADGSSVEVRGWRQERSQVSGTLATGGSFEASEGRAAIACSTARRPRASSLVHATPRPFFVAPGGPTTSGSKKLTALVGFCAILGGALLLRFVRG